MKYHVLKHLKVNPFRKDTFHHLNYVDYIKQNFKKKKNSITGHLQEEKPAVELKPDKEEEGRKRGWPFLAQELENKAKANRP